MAPTTATVRTAPSRTRHHVVDRRIEVGSLVAAGFALLVVGVLLRDAAGDATALVGLLVVAAAFVSIEIAALARAERTGHVVRTSRAAKLGSLLTFRRWP